VSWEASEIRIQGVIVNAHVDDTIRRNRLNSYHVLNSLPRKVPPGPRNIIQRVADRVRGRKQPALLTGALEPLTQLRCGIVGFGAMGKCHADVLHTHPYFKLAGLTSTTPQKDAAEKYGCRWFDSAEQMIRSGEVEVVIIATPHWHHAALVVGALRAGLHVVCEKPLTVTSVQADEVLNAAKESKGILTCVFQGRFEPVFQQTKALLTSGELGPIIRCEMEESFWRSDAYYRSNSWRGTWKGEGGGVLINQGPHVLDRYAWLCGMPESVTGFCDTTLHRIEVEDSASAIFRHAGGWHGHVHINTNECPQSSRLMISCDRGRITIEDGRMRIDRLADSIRNRTAAASESFGQIECKSVDVAGALIESPQVLLSRFYENIALAIAGKQSLAITATEAANSVGLANAIQLSSATKGAITLPLDSAAYETFLTARLKAPSA
jgi:predicted dehydrogenase